MKNIIDNFNKIIFLEKVVLILVFLLPFALLLSIFIADLFTSVIALIVLYWIFKNKEFIQLIKNIHKPLSIILVFYFFIIISLIFSHDFNKSFLPSFFYFRYFFLSLAIFFLIYKFDFLNRLVLYSLLILVLIITIHSIVELLKIKNIFGLSLPSYRIDSGTTYFITSFFDDEKKLGSFIARLLPLIISLLVLLNFKLTKKIDINFLIIILTGTLIFLSSERVAFFLFIFFFLFLFKFLEKRLLISITIFFMVLSVLIFEKKLIEKYIYATLTQFGVTKSYNINDVQGNFIPIWEEINFSNMNYISDEHSKLIKSGIEIFKLNPITGSGIKTYHRYCKNLKEEKSLDIKCSSHPHNTYIQILSDIGLFGALIVLFIFIYIFSINLKIFLSQNPSNIKKSFFILNLGILMNLMPFIPSGSFFNNWINIMIYYPIGFWFYLFFKYNKEK
mgnify:CR=1 FL=1